MDRDQAVWVGLRGGGIARLRTIGGAWDYFTSYDRLSHDSVLELFEDRARNIWVGTSGGGLNSFYVGKVTTFTLSEGLPNDIVTSLMSDRQGHWWIGTDNGLFHSWPDGSSILRKGNGLRSNSIQALAESADGSIWVGHEWGLDRLRGGSRVSVPFDIAQLGSVRTILEDRSGALWLGTTRGLLRVEGATVTQVDGVVGASVATLYMDRAGDVLVGIRHRGLLRHHAGEYTWLTRSSGLSDASVMALHEDADGALWIGTSSGGLNRLKDGIITVFRERDGLPGDAIHTLNEDASGHLWMGSNRGVWRVSKGELNAYARGEIAAFKSMQYGRGEGMRSITIPTGSGPASWRGLDGRLWFATTTGAVVIDPSNITINQTAPPVVFEGLKANGEPARVDRPLPADRRDLEFQYTALSFVATNGVAFRYKLDGFDRDWIDPGSRRTAYYTNVPPGRYTFRVKAANSDACGTRPARQWPLPSSRISTRPGGSTPRARGA